MKKSKTSLFLKQKRFIQLISCAVMSSCLFGGTTFAAEQAFEMPITGNMKDTDYVEIGHETIIPGKWGMDDCNYTFGQDITIAPTVEGALAAGVPEWRLDAITAVYSGGGVIDATGHTLNIEQKNLTDRGAKGIVADTRDVTVKADKININMSSSAEGKNIIGISKERSNSLNINGNLNIDIAGMDRVRGIEVNDRGTINLSGDTIVKVNKDAEDGTALFADSGVLNVNTAGNKTVKIDGDIQAQVSLWGSTPAQAAEINLTLSDDASYLNGITTYEQDVNDEGIFPQYKAGNVNLTLKNGALWNNEKYSNAEYQTGFNGSKIKSFVGGSTAETAGVIHQKDAHKITLDNFTGHAVVVYDHSEAAPAEFTAGDIQIGSAAKDSSITLRTGSTAVDGTNKDEVLNALAGKLYYTGAITAENNLSGKVEIADGLTASSVSKYVGNLNFNETTGQGIYEAKQAFEMPITSNMKDTDYVEIGHETIIPGKWGMDDCNYTFGQDITIAPTVEGALAAGVPEWRLDAITAVYSGGGVIDATGHTLNIEQKNLTDRGAKGIVADTRDVTVKADKININMSSSAEGKNIIGISKERSNSLNINGNLNIDIAGMDRVRGIEVNDRGTINLSGDTIVKVNKDAEDGTALFADSGVLNVNTAGNKTVKIDGDIQAQVSLWGSTPAQAAEINLTLSDDASYLNGITTYEQDVNDEGIFPQYKAGNVNLTLKNGALWNNEKYSNAEYQTGFNGSKIKSFVGGSTAETAGVIHQKDAHKITLDNFTGHAVVVYDHSEAAPAEFTAGDIQIGSAAKDSSITLRTSSTAVDGTNKDEVLNALAGKLYYMGATNAENNLSGKVEIADGLTASSVSKYLGNVNFNETTGQGIYEKVETPTDPEVAVNFTTSITGNATDTEYVEKGILKDGVYTFTKDSTITSDAPVTIDAKKVTINAADSSLNLKSTASDAKGIKIVAPNAGFIPYPRPHYESAADVTIKASNLNIDVQDAVGRVAGLYVDEKENNVNLQGKLTIKVAGNNESYGVFARGDNNKVNIDGLEIKVNAEAADSAAIIAKNNSVINVNASGTKDVKIDGDLKTTTDIWSSATSNNTAINLTMNNDQSYLHGILSYKENINDEGLYPQSYAGKVNLNLSKGALWQNAKYGQQNYEQGFTGSRVASFVGGANHAEAGIIHQQDANGITIDSFSGHAIVIYDHNQATPAEFAAGNLTINHASENSGLTLRTDSVGIDANNKEVVLEALANKLIYADATKGMSNLTGKVEIADGLTASSVSKYLGDISYDSKGQGHYLKQESKPDVPEGPIYVYNTPITGDAEKDQAYIDGGVRREDGSYVFDQDGTIAIVGRTQAAIMPEADIKIDATGKKLVVSNETTFTTKPAYGIGREYKKLDISAKEIDVSVKSVGRSEAIHIRNANDTTTFNSDVTVRSESEGYVLGTYVLGSHVIFNGKYTSNAIDGTSGIHTTSGDLSSSFFDHYEKSSLYAGGGSLIEVNGAVNIGTKIGTGILANQANSRIDINGGGIINTVGDDESVVWSAIAECSTVNLNVKMNENRDIAEVLDKDITIIGNVGALNGAVPTTVVIPEPGTTTVVNIGLNSTASSFKGVAVNNFTEKDKQKGYVGKINMHVGNGANWTNEQCGAAVEGFKGSHVAKFVGGESEAKAGNIFQNDANNITIDNYSGNTNIFYAHTGNGEAADNYAAGDTIIKGAAAGSVVSMITDNTGIEMDNKDSVNNVLNALAGKLTYSNFVNGEKNLTGFVKIADGLTASSAALKTGNIAFNTEDGKGSLNKEDVKPEPPTPPTYPEDQKADKFNQGITGNDEKYKEEGVLKEDGSYVFTKNPTSIEVEKGAAVNATKNNINIDTTKAKLELKGETGINANGADVTVKGYTDISGNVGINAANGNVTLNGSSTISGTDAAINAGENGNVNVNGNNSALTINGSINADGGNITVDSGKASSTIKGDVNAANGGSVVINLTEKNSEMTGGYNVDGNSSIALSLANGATWKLTDGEEAAGMSLLRMAKGAAAAGLTINGGATKEATGYLDMTKRTKDLDIAHYSGWETVIYDHDGKGDKVEDYKSGDTVIAKADKGSGVILSTDVSGITMTDKNAVEATLKALAQKVTYKDHEANGENMSGKVQIAEGLTSSSVSKNLGTIHWDENGKGQYDLDSVNWSQIIEGDYETFVMKGVRSAATTSLHTWRDNMQDTYTGADLADADGIFAKALGGKTSSDVKGVKDDNTYYGVQVGYDKAAANGWHTGVAFDYRNGDSNYLLGGKGDNQMYSLGVYGVKSFDNDAFFRVAAKVGRVENEYDVYNEIRSLKLHGDYKANAYGLTMEYGKTFGTEESYFTPKAQLTWSQVGAKDYTAHTDKATMQINQDSYSSFVGRLGFEAGVKSEKGRVYAGLFAAHEFNGDISASYFANDGDRKHTSFDGEETWMEMKLGGTYDFSNNAHLYADFAKDFNGNFERKWKMNVGLRFEF